MLAIIGDSHIRTMRQALDRDDAELAKRLADKFGEVKVTQFMTAIAFHEPFFKAEDGAVRLEEQATGKLAQLLGTDGIFRVPDDRLYGLSLGFHSTVMLRQSYWREFTLLPGSTDKHFISSSVFKEAVLNENKHTVAFVKAVKALGLNFFLIGAPPMRQAMVRRQRKFASADELIAIETSYRAIMKDVYDGLGVRYILSPEEASDGPILKTRYDNPKPDDFAHADADYGVLVLNQILAAF